MARTILVVDDEPTVRETLAESLEGEGFRVVTADDGREALELFRDERPDLILLDLMLPELSGIEVCRIVRRESGVPILMLTAKDSELDKVVGLELGADDYVTKPFSLRELGARVRALLRRTEPVSPLAPEASAPAPAPIRRAGRGRPRRAQAPEGRIGRPAQAACLRAARVPPAQPGPGIHQGPAARASLGLRLCGRDAHGRRPRALAALGDRGGSGTSRRAPDRARRRLRASEARVGSATLAEHGVQDCVSNRGDEGGRGDRQHPRDENVPRHAPAHG